MSENEDLNSSYIREEVGETGEPTVPPVTLSLDEEEFVKTELREGVAGGTVGSPAAIRHIVISGGGAQGFSFYGILRESNKAGLWNIKNIKTIYGTSIGAFIAVILCLDFEWDIIDDFLIKRPWHNIIKFDLTSYFRVFEYKGIIKKTVFEEIMRPLFAAKDIPIDITMKGLYDITGIELHLFTVEANQLDIVDISYKTHPEWTVTKALHCSSTLPIIFEPYIEDNKIYIDGGLLANYPLKYCIANGADPDEIIGMYKKTTVFKKDILIESSFFDYVLGMLNRVFDKIHYMVEGINQKIKYEYEVINTVVNVDNLVSTASSMEERQKLIKIGVDLFHEQAFTSSSSIS
jgi:predicted patatin/cPLA2 family phospholipase